MQDQSENADEGQTFLPSISKNSALPGTIEDLELIAMPNSSIEKLDEKEETMRKEKDDTIIVNTLQPVPVEMAALPKGRLLTPEKDRMKVNPMPPAVNGSQAKPPVDEFKTVFDTIAERTRRIQMYSPEQYNQIYHLKNLKNIELLGEKPKPEAILSQLVSGQNNSDLNLDNYWIESGTRPIICNGRIFSIATNRINNKKLTKEGVVQDRIQKTSLAIFVHDPNDAEGRHSVKLFEKVLWYNDQPHNWHSVSRPAVLNQKKLFFATLENDMETYTVKHQVWCFNFEDCIAPTKPLYEREEKMALDKNINKYHYGCQASLSIYVPVDSKGGIDTNRVLSEEEFLENTFISVRYRTSKEKEDQPGDKIKVNKAEDEDEDEDNEPEDDGKNKYYSSVNVFHLKDFAQADWGGAEGDGIHYVHKEDAFVGSNGYKDSDIFPQIQFVMNGQFYVLKRSIKMQIGQMEIEKEEENQGKPKLGPYQDVNKLKNEIREYFMSFFLRPFSIYNVNSGSEDIEHEHLIDLQCWEYPGQRSKRKGASKGNQATEEALIVPNYHDVAEHFKFINQDKDIKGGETKHDDGTFDVSKSERIDSMSIIFNMTGHQPHITMIVAADNYLHAKIINNRPNFTRMFRQEEENKSLKLQQSASGELMKKGETYGKTIKQDDWVIEKNMFGPDERIKQGDVQIRVRGSEGHSIYIEISYNRYKPIPVHKASEDEASPTAPEEQQFKKENEILLIEELQLSFDVKQFQSATLCWKNNLQVAECGKEKQRNFLCGLLDKSGHVCQIFGYKIGFNSEELKERCVKRTEAMSGLEYIGFLRRSHKIINLAIVGVNLVVLKEPYDQHQLEITPQIKKNEVTGENEIITAQLAYKNFQVNILNRNDKAFQIQSDVAKTMYKYYFNGQDKEPQIVHIQCLLQDLLEDTGKSPDVQANSVINSIKQSNGRLQDQIDNGSVFGIPASFFLHLQQKYISEEGLNQLDRYALLKSACKSLLNMVPVNFQDFRINKERIDLLQPIETLDCQNECDFFLDNPSYVKYDLESEKQDGDASTGQKPLFLGIIQQFVKEMKPEYQEDVIKSLKDNMWWRDTHKMINALFFSNSLMRCFTQKKVRIQSAKLLIDHLMNNKITMSERDIIMSTLPHILDCKYEPFSFQKLSKFFQRPKMNQEGPTNSHEVAFSQNIAPREEILFNDNSEEITMFDQRNFAINSLDFKQECGTQQLMSDNEATDKDLLTIPVEHYIIDFHSLYLFQKLTFIRSGKDMKHYRSSTIQEIISKINGKFGYDIEKHIALQRIIDAQYVSSQSYFKWLFRIYMVGFACCFIAQMQIEGDAVSVRVVGTICLAVTIFFQLLSLIEFKNKVNKWDFFNFFNIANNFCYIMYYVYYSHRQKNPSYAYLPRDLESEAGKLFPYHFQAFTSITSIIILSGILIKSMDLVRYNKNMGKLVKLVFAVLYDVQNLFMFLVLNICLFSLYYLAMGLKLTNEGPIEENQVYWDYFIQSWKIATKGSGTKIETVWVDSYDFGFLDEAVMLLTIINEIYLKIIMLSFLIAIVKKTFDTQMKIEAQNFYEQRSGMNTESSTVFNQLGLLDQQDMFILSAQFENPPQQDKIDKLQKEMHHEMKEMKKMISALAHAK